MNTASTKTDNVIHLVCKSRGNKMNNSSDNGNTSIGVNDMTKQISARALANAPGVIVATNNTSEKNFTGLNRSDTSIENVALAKNLLSQTGLTSFRVVYLSGNKECRSGWFRSVNRAQQALRIIKGKGHQATIFRD